MKNLKQALFVLIICCHWSMMTSLIDASESSDVVQSSTKSIVQSATAEVAGDIDSSTDQENLQFNMKNLFDHDELFGKRAQDFAWSEDGRYLAYRWNVVDATGYNLWLFDSKTGSNENITSVTMFVPFDPEALEYLKSEREGKLNEKDAPVYNGVSSFKWAEHNNDLLIKYKSDLYHYMIDDATIVRLTKTKHDENNFQFTRNGDGFFYWNDSNLYKVKFGDSYIEEIQPAIPDDQRINQKILSPDQQWLAIVASKDKGSRPEPRKVGYVSFKDRFAEWKEHTRPLAEDPQGPENERWIYLQKIGDKIRNASDDVAVKVYHHPGGDEPLDVSRPDWSQDSTKIVFRTYNPDSEDIFIYMASTEAIENYDDEDENGDEKRKAKLIHQARNSGTERSPERIDPEFTPDGKLVVALFEDTGFRQPWIINPITQGKVPILRGDFDADPISFNEDNGELFVLANKEHPAQKDIYRVDINTGEMTRLTKRQGEYFSPTVSKNGKNYAALFQHWDQPVELIAGRPNHATETMLTNSHKDYINELNQLKPEMFSYQNEHGQTLHGMLFLPPHMKKEQKYPVMIYTYGGPLGAGSSMVKYGGFGTYNYRFPMYMAKTHGYIAAVIDPRGSSNYGALFERANWQKPGEPQVEDLSAGLDYLVENHQGDPNRSALYGWSFGGFVTQMAMYTKPEAFTVGMAGAGPTEWRNYYGSYTSRTIDPFDEPEDGETFSILPLAKNLKGRLMLLHGIEDTNVLFQDTVKVYQALMKAGKGELVELILDTTGGHHMGGDFEYNYIFWLFEDFLLRTLGSGYENAALNKTANASSNAENLDASLAIDGNLLTIWKPEKDDASPTWKINLGEERDLIAVVIRFVQDSAQVNYTIEIINDADDWESIHEQKNQDDAPETQPIFIDGQKAQHLKIIFKDIEGKKLPEIREVYVYTK